MMTKTKSKRVSLLKYTAVLPLLLFMTVLFSCEENSSVASEQINSEVVMVKNTSEVNKIYEKVDEMPRFPGCEEMTGSIEDKQACAMQKLIDFMMAEVKYPEYAKKTGKEGVAIIAFVVDKDGKIINPEIKQDPGDGLGEEASRVVQAMPNWIPGVYEGKTVKVSMNLPVRFKL